MSDEDYNFETADAGASKTYPIEAGQLKKGGHIVIKGKPCKVINLSTSKTGKHGHAKVNITAIDIFTNKKLEDMCPSTHNVEAPVIKRAEYQLVGIEDDGFLSLVDGKGDVKDDYKLVEQEHNAEMYKAMLKEFEDGEDILVTIISAMDQEQVVSYKKDTSK